MIQIVFITTFLLIGAFSFASNKKDCGKLYPVYARETTVGDFVGLNQITYDEKYINRDGQVYYLRGCEEGRKKYHLGYCFIDTSYVEPKDNYLHIYSCMTKCFTKKNITINKGDIIGCTHHPKSLEYFKVRCYGDCWEEWQ